MAKTIQYNLRIDTKNSMKSIEDLENELSVMKNELKGLTVGSDAFNQLKTKVIEADSQVKNLNKSIEGMDMDQIAGEAGKFAGGVAGITSAFVLLGGAENKTMKEMQENLNMSLGIIMGVKGAIEAWTSATKLLGPAMKAVNRIIAANPIGILVTAVVALGAAIINSLGGFKQLGEWLGLIASDQDKLNEINEEAIKIYAEEAGNLRQLKEQLNDTNISQKDKSDIIKSLNEQYGEYLPQLISENDTQEQINEKLEVANDLMLSRAKIKAAEAELSKQYQELVKNELILEKWRGKSGEYVNKIRQKVRDTQEEINHTIEITNGYIKDEVDNTKDLNKEIDDRLIKEGKVNKLKEKYEKKQKEIDDKKEKAAEEARKKQEAFNKQLLNIREQLRIQGLKDKELEIERLDIWYEKQKLVLGNNLELKELYEKKWIEIKQKYKDKENAELEKANQEEKERREKANQEEKERREKANKEYKEILEQEKQDEIDATLARVQAEVDAELDAIEKRKKARIESVYNILETTANITDVFMNAELVRNQDNEAKKEEIRKKYAKRQQKIDIALATVSTGLAVAQIWKADSVFPQPFDSIYRGIQTGLVLSTLAAQISKMSSVKFAKGGLLQGPSHANGGILTSFGELEGGEAVINRSATRQFSPILSAINQSTGGNPIGGSSGSIIDYDLLASKINNKKVYVVSSEITKQQYTDTKIQDRITF